MFEVSECGYDECMRQPEVEYPPELLDDPSLPLPERVERMMARDDLDWEARQAAYGNVVIVQFGRDRDAEPEQECGGMAGKSLPEQAP